ncbi:MAG: hypothetical protein CMJ81_05870 [Planctomycetaceae bacterium]|nr:hypothetical protein [Planctomycetaceae bacterium]
MSRDVQSIDECEFNLDVEPVEGDSGRQADPVLSDCQGATDLEFDWEVNDDVNTLERIYRDLSGIGSCGSLSQDQDGPVHDSLAANPVRYPAVESNMSSPPLVVAPRAVPTADKSVHFFSWSALTLGLMAVVCGGSLMAWAYFGARSELWTVGVVAACVGQIGLLIGLILHLDRLWHSNRENSQTLGSLHYRLADLRHTTSMLHSSHQTEATIPEIHIDAALNTEAKLASLKGQLDQLTSQMQQQQA